MSADRIHAKNRARIRLQWRALEYLRDRSGEPLPRALRWIDDADACADTRAFLADWADERTVYRVMADLRKLREAYRTIEDSIEENPPGVF